MNINLSEFIFLDLADPRHLMLIWNSNHNISAVDVLQHLQLHHAVGYVEFWSSKRLVKLIYESLTKKILFIENIFEFLSLEILAPVNLIMTHVAVFLICCACRVQMSDCQLFFQYLTCMISFTSCRHKNDEQVRTMWEICLPGRGENRCRQKMA